MVVVVCGGYCMLVVACWLLRVVSVACDCCCMWLLHVVVACAVDVLCGQKNFHDLLTQVVAIMNIFKDESCIVLFPGKMSACRCYVLQ